MRVYYRNSDFWPTMLLSDRVAMVKSMNGFHYTFDPLDLSIGMNLMRGGEHEFWLYPILEEILRPGDFVVEGGANIGVHSVEMADLVSPSGYVFCCDPNPDVIPYLRRNLILNDVGGRARVLPVALTDKIENNVDLYMLRDDNGGSALRLLSGNAVRHTNKVQVATTTVVSVSEGRPLKLLRLDTEGCEAAILRSVRGMDIEHYIIENNLDYYEPEIDVELDYLRARGKTCYPVGKYVFKVEPYHGKLKDLPITDVWIH